MAGADDWIYSNGRTKFTRGWWAEWLRMPQRIVRHWIERAMRGYSMYDMWDGQSYLADVISGSAYWLFVRAHGHPMLMTYDEWLEVLLTISDGFSIKDKCGDPAVPEMAWDLLRENFGSIWD